MSTGMSVILLLLLLPSFIEIQVLNANTIDIWSGFTLFANVPFMEHQVYMS